MFQDRSGRVVKRFHVRIDAKWKGGRGHARRALRVCERRDPESFWTLVREGDRYSGTAADVVGPGTGIAAGNALNLRYVLALPVDGRLRHVDMDDWMYRMADRTVRNRTTMPKSGFRVGEATLAFRKR